MITPRCPACRPLAPHFEPFCKACSCPAESTRMAGLLHSLRGARCRRRQGGAGAAACRRAGGLCGSVVAIFSTICATALAAQQPQPSPTPGDCQRRCCPARSTAPSTPSIYLRCAAAHRRPAPTPQPAGPAAHLAVALAAAAVGLALGSAHLASAAGCTRRSLALPLALPPPAAAARRRRAHPSLGRYPCRSRRWRCAAGRPAG